MKSLSTGVSNTFYLIAVAIMVSAFIYGVEVLLREFVMPQDKFSQQVRRVYEGTANNVIIGDSQAAAFHRVRTQGFDFTYLGRGGLTPDAIRELLDAYFHHREPGNIIITYGRGMFSRARQDMGDLGFADSFFQLKNGVKSPLYFFEPMINRNLSKLAWLLELQMDGQLVRGIPVINAKESVRKSERKQRGLSLEPTLSIYREIIELLLRRNANVCLVGMSWRLEVSDDGSVAQKEMRRFHNEMRVLANTLGARHIISSELNIKLNEIMFRDDSHLSKDAEKIIIPHLLEYCLERKLEQKHMIYLEGGPYLLSAE